MEEKHIIDIQEAGYDLFIECKGKGRGYAMTYEASVRKVATESMSREEWVDSIYTQAHAVGDSLLETVKDIKRQLDIPQT